jgi:hypothetical protein
LSHAPAGGVDSARRRGDDAAAINRHGMFNVRRQG